LIDAVCLIFSLFILILLDFKLIQVDRGLAPATAGKTGGGGPMMAQTGHPGNLQKCR
jgi:hypothetical protein